MNATDCESDLTGLLALAAVEKEMCRSSRNFSGCRFSPKLARPSNPLGKLLDNELESFTIIAKQCGGSLEPSSSVSTESSLKD